MSTIGDVRFLRHTLVKSDSIIAGHFFRERNSMHRAINTLKAVLVFSCLVIAACSGSSPADSQSSAIDSGIKAATTAAATNAVSVSGTKIPSATRIIDSSGNTWTVSGGVIQENGALAGYSAAVTKLLYDNSTIYQENSAGGWWSWSGSTWVATSDPSKVSSASGTNIPTAKQITDTSGNIWAVSSGVIYENGVLAGYSASVTKLFYDNSTIYQENSAGGWWSWNGSTWVASSNPSAPTASTTGTATLSWNAPTANTNGTSLTDLAGYIVHYGTSSGALTQTIQLTDPDLTTYVVRNLAAGTYYFAVSGYATTGTQGTDSPEVSKTIP